MRLRYTQKLAAYAAEVYEGISGGKESFSARYLSSCGPMPEHPQREDVTALIEEAVKESRGQDIKMGQTGVGPHRDDLEIEVDGKSARSFGSQGQQRSCVLALKLAECRILEEGMKEPPIVLLDDVMSELDEGRRSYLLNHLTGRQIFITCCDDEMIASLNGGRVFQVSGGKVL
jgi:DNA replication and repair protein RecF